MFLLCEKNFSRRRHFFKRRRTCFLLCRKISFLFSLLKKNFFFSPKRKAFLFLLQRKAFFLLCKRTNNKTFFLILLKKKGFDFSFLEKKEDLSSKRIKRKTCFFSSREEGISSKEKELSFFFALQKE